jgi:hypothetical protein
MIQTPSSLKKQTQSRLVLINIVTNAGEYLEIMQHADSGKVVTRAKTHTINGVKHTGIIVGIDKRNTLWVVHNHIRHGKPIYETINGYAAGEDVFYDDRICHYSPIEIVYRAHEEFMLHKRYAAVNYNCQTFVNRIVCDQQSSESIDVISHRVMTVGALTGIFGLITGNKALVGIGATIVGAGGAAKIYSKYDKNKY